MTSRSVIDRSTLADLMSVEELRFVDLHPRSAELAESGRRHLLAGVPMPWMTRWPGRVPDPRGVGGRGAVRRRRRHRVRRLLPRRHRRDGRPRRRRSRRGGGRRIDHDAAERGRSVGRRRAPPTLRHGEVAAHDVGNRRQPVRAPIRTASDRSSEDRRDGLVLPRHRRRDARDARSRWRGGQPTRRRSARRSIRP